MREEKRTGKFFEGYEPKFDFKGAGKDREQKIAEITKELDEYDAWIEKHPEHKGRQGKFPEWCRILQKENQKLREEQEVAKREAIRWNNEAVKLREELTIEQESNGAIYIEREEWLKQYREMEKRLFKALQEMDKYRQTIHNLRRKLTGCEERNRCLGRDQKKITEGIQWIKKRHEEAWTYEPGTGEVVEEILRKLEEIGVME